MVTTTSSEKENMVSAVISRGRVYTASSSMSSYLELHLTMAGIPWNFSIFFGACPDSGRLAL